MSTSKAISVEDYKIVSSFHSLRKTLLQDRFADRLEKPLAYWALPNDRRLPLAFLGRSLRDLLATSFEELSATPGIGQKKISSLVKLLSRATKDHPPAVPFGLTELTERKSSNGEKNQHNGRFEPAIVSEALWAQWRATVEQRGVRRQRLGTLAPSLQALPTVIWHTPLEYYLDYTLAEIRQLKTHGEKRVRVVLEIFYLINQLLGSAGGEEHLSIRVVPKFVDSLERWTARVVEEGVLPAGEVRKCLTIPLLNQLKIDGGDSVYDLCAVRLGLDGPPQNVRQQAKRMGLTRARVYQLLEEAARIMDVRWSEGEALLGRLVAVADRGLQPPHPEQRLLKATVDLFFPGKRRLADEDVASESQGAVA